MASDQERGEDASRRLDELIRAVNCATGLSRQPQQSPNDAREYLHVAFPTMRGAAPVHHQPDVALPPSGHLPFGLPPPQPQCLDELEMEQTEEVEVHDISGGIKHTKPTLLDVLHFLTGSKYPPSTHSMQQKGRITFFHNCPRRRIEASTCQLILKIPVNERYNSELFTFSFIEDIMQAPGFGLL
eukprot:Seg8746.2 transcript_id=Seg8746.2/GoldUCD/mRNA.D3Y31 product="hypothetical protein" protein_id=Seg8746.2/GoldUCD/D3Y31